MDGVNWLNLEMRLSEGDKLGPYEIVSTLGVGGMGEVWKARDTRLDRIIAIKVLPSDKLADPERKRRFVQEAKAASALNHPNIVIIYDIGSEEKCDYLAMEFVDGKTLEQLTPPEGLGIPLALRYAAQASDALAKAHAAGIVHRDLKPGNIMVTGDGRVKVQHHRHGAEWRNDGGFSLVARDQLREAEISNSPPERSKPNEERDGTESGDMRMRTTSMEVEPQ
jgi:serine/threonine protein kinase